MRCVNDGQARGERQENAVDEAAPLRQRNGPEARDARERGDPAHFRVVDGLGPCWRAIPPAVVLERAVVERPQERLRDALESGIDARHVHRS